MIRNIQNKIKGLKDKYYLILITNEDKLNTNFSLGIYINSKEGSPISIPMNKYISGSFNLLNNRVNQTQKYYIKNDIDENDNNDFIIEFSSNYKNIELIFNDSIMKCYKKIIKEGIQKFYLTISFSSKIKENFFTVQLNNINKKNNDNNEYLKKVNYIFKFYHNSEDKPISDLFEFSPNFIRENKELIFKNNDEGKFILNNTTYLISYFLNVYQKVNILKDELLNTIASKESISKYNYKNFSKIPQKELKFYLKDLNINEDYIVSLFIKVEENQDNDNDDDDIEKYYYSITYNIDKNNDENVSNNKELVIFLSIGFTFLILLLIIIFILFYRKIRKKK